MGDSDAFSVSDALSGVDGWMDGWMELDAMPTLAVGTLTQA